MDNNGENRPYIVPPPPHRYGIRFIWMSHHCDLACADYTGASIAAAAVAWREGIPVEIFRDGQYLGTVRSTN